MHGLHLRGQQPIVMGVQKSVFADPGRFGRMFPQLRSLKEHQLAVSPDVLGAVGGPMDGGNTANDLDDNPRIRNGFTFLGQFLDHDVTFDPTSILEQQNDPHAIQNFRTPVFELDSVYGAGPMVQPYFYDGNKFLLSDDGYDLPRNSLGRAVIGDPRNDENLLISQLHQAIMRFHNVVLDEYANSSFEEAQRLVRWHYQWIILHEYLPLVCGEEVIENIFKDGRQFYHFEHHPFMPVEVSVAVFRFGHSQIRPRYRINKDFEAPLFPDQPDAPPGNDLRGNRPIPPERRMDFRNFFGPSAGRGKRIDKSLAKVLLRLPDSVVDPSTPAQLRSLAIRNIRRSLAFALPAGQTVARFMCIDEIPDEELWDGVPNGKGLAPLWFYILREAELRASGRHLHGVGAQILAEVFIGLIQGDSASFLNHEPCWTPTLPSAKKDIFTFEDLLKIADRAIGHDKPCN